MTVTEITDDQRSAADELAVLSVHDLDVRYDVGRGKTVRAVKDVSFDLRRGETLGVVGESGCGKSTLARALVRMTKIASGSIAFDGNDLVGMSRRELRQIRPRLQMIFQDPVSSMNPRRKVRDIVAEPLSIWNWKTPEERAGRVDELLDLVGMPSDVFGERRPQQLSGGQCQRVSIARALALSPSVIICDEPVSALDMSVQAQVLNLLEDLKAALGLTLLFISHDLSVVKNISDRIAVMYLGRIVELTTSEALYEAPAHPYSQGLLGSIPTVDDTESPAKRRLTGELPSPVDPPSGCHFRTRCPFAQDRCANEKPELRHIADGHLVACHFPQHGAAPWRDDRGA
ncbi:ABC transporter ATP-binding protein [Amycolatopsis sp. GM8]|uniref:ABC transporter ATP-binding protein n=1 Tax=Amycolatopsis sp. GM8 TaxID=2896530 RepID=UPI001EFF9B60|nr:oligopeptide/dipeptide ABC transporter ATP-binding protein [Amycolatopsis sp. GM8]